MGRASHMNGMELEPDVTTPCLPHQIGQLRQAYTEWGLTPPSSSELKSLSVYHARKLIRALRGG